MIGRSQSMATLRGGWSVWPAPPRVVLTGPPGPGEGGAARYIHAQSQRAEGPFVVSNAATIEPDRMEAVLFGQVRHDGRVGQAFDRAHGGTLFFDEVAEMPWAPRPDPAHPGGSGLRGQAAEVVRVDVRPIPPPPAICARDRRGPVP